MKISVELIIGIIGAITGVVSLLWHILKIRPRLRIDETYFKLATLLKYTSKDSSGYMQNIDIDIRLDNPSLRSTTLKSIWIDIGRMHFQQKPRIDFSSVHINLEPGDSKLISLQLSIKEKEFKSLFDKDGNIKLGIQVFHTFGKTKKIERKAGFQTGHFHLV